MPSLHRDKRKKSFIAQAEFKTSSFRDRFDMIKQRVLRNAAFRPKSIAGSEDSYYQV
jgi:DNA polymerase epsilon subunit 2